MTIAAAYLVSDGVIFGADSTTTISQQQNVTQLLNHAQKVFEIGEPGTGRLAVATWGSGSYGNVSHRTIVARASDAIADNDSVSHAKDKFTQIACAEAADKFDDQNVVGYFFGGINLDTRLPECWAILISKDGIIEESPLSIGEARFTGAPQVFSRLFHGVDPGFPEELKKQLLKKCDPLPDDFDNIFDQCIEETLSKFRSVGYHDLPVRDAIDYIHTYLFSTVKSYKLRYGPPPCGGPIEIGFVTVDRKFRWLSHKQFSTAVREHHGIE